MTPGCISNKNGNMNRSGQALWMTSTWSSPMLLIIQIAFVILNQIMRVHANTDLRFLNEPGSLLMAPGGKDSIRCQTIPATAHVQWLLNGHPISDHSVLGIRIAGHKLNVRLPHEDAGELPGGTADLNGAQFQCLARHRGKALLSIPAKLLIAGLAPFPPRDDINVTVIAGNTGVIPCSPPYSVPTAVTEFMYNSSETRIDRSTDRLKLMPSGDLQILSATVHDSGVYHCTVHNPFLERKREARHKVHLRVIRSSGPKPPRLTRSPPTIMETAMGSNVTFECAAEGFPVPSVTWSKRGGSLPLGRLKQVGGNLLLFNLRRGDDGTYICQASNGIGLQVEAQTELTIQETPDIIKGPQDQHVYEGENVTFDCLTRGQPKPVVWWLQNGQKLEQESRITIKESKLIIHKATRKHSGIYQCYVSNELGTTYAASILTVAASNLSGSSPDFDEYSDIEEDFYREEVGNGRSHLGTSDDYGIGRRKKKKHKGGTKMVPPTRPEVTRLSDDSVMVRWDVPQNDGLPIRFFKVQYKEVGRRGGDWMTTDDDIPPHIHSHAVIGLKPATTYRFRIAAVYSNHDNQVGHSSSKFTLHKDPPMKKPISGPTIMDIKAVSPSAIMLDWEHAGSGSVPVEGFFIYYRTTESAGDYLKVTVLGANTRSHIISHLLPETSYDIKMQCFNIAGTSNFSNIEKCKTLASEVPSTKSQSPKLRQGSGSSSGGIGSSSGVGTTVASSGSLENNRLLYMVLGIVLGVMLFVLAVFVTLCILRQRQQKQQARRQQNMNGSQNKVRQNGHPAATNGHIPGNNKVNISVNPLSALDTDDSCKAAEYLNIASNNNDVRLSANQRSADAFVGPSIAGQQNYRNERLEELEDHELEEMHPMLSAAPEEGTSQEGAGEHSPASIML